MFFYPVAKMVEKSGIVSGSSPSEIIFWIFAIALLLPEVSFIISKKFRIWLKDGVENGDGILHSKDLKELPTLVGAYYCGKLFALLILMDTFYDIEVKDSFVYLCFSGFAGPTSILQISKIFKR